MHPLIFLPGTNEKDAEQLADVGLPDLVHGAMAVSCPAGPNDHQGVLFGWRPRSGRMKIQFLGPEVQTWLPAVADPLQELEAGRYWVGWWTDTPPTPEILRREYPFAGREVALGDDHEWLIPIVEKLPAEMRLADDGSWRFVTQRQFHEFTLVARAFQERLAGDDAWFLWDEAANFVLQALRLNYRLTPEIVSHLGLFKTGVGQGLHRAIVTICRPDLIATMKPEV